MSRPADMWVVGALTVAYLVMRIVSYLRSSVDVETLFSSVVSGSELKARADTARSLGVRVQPVEPTAARIRRSVRRRQNGIALVLFGVLAGAVLSGGNVWLLTSVLFSIALLTLWRLVGILAVAAGPVASRAAREGHRRTGAVEPGASCGSAARLGAARTYVPDLSWQVEVDAAIGTCGTILLLAGATSGLGWELDRIRERGRDQRLFILLPPLPYDQTLQRLYRICEQLELAELDALDRSSPGRGTQFALGIVGIGFTQDGHALFYSGRSRDEATLRAAVTLAQWRTRGVIADAI